MCDNFVLITRVVLLLSSRQIIIKNIQIYAHVQRKNVSKIFICDSKT